jgi:hypothetical protein
MTSSSSTYQCSHTPRASGRTCGGNSDGTIEKRPKTLAQQSPRSYKVEVSYGDMNVLYNQDVHNDEVIERSPKSSAVRLLPNWVQTLPCAFKHRHIARLIH